MAAQHRRELASALRRGDGGRIRSLRGSSARALLAQIKFGKLHVARPGDLQVTLGSNDNMNIASYPLDEARFVRRRHPVLACARKGFQEQGGKEHLRSL